MVSSESWATWTQLLRTPAAELKPANLLQLGPSLGAVTSASPAYLRPRAEPRDFIDRPRTFFAAQSYSEYEFYTIDLGAVDRFAFYPPEGPRSPKSRIAPTSPLPNSPRSGQRRKGRGPAYRPLDILADLNSAVGIMGNTCAFCALSQTSAVLRQVRLGPEVSGRGFPPQAVWTSQVIDLGQTVLGVRFGASVAARRRPTRSRPDAPTSAQVESKPA